MISNTIKLRPVKLLFVIFGPLTLIGKLWKFFSTNSGSQTALWKFFPFKKFGLKITDWRFFHYKSWYPSRGKYLSHVMSLVWCHMGYRYTKPSTLLKTWRHSTSSYSDVTILAKPKCEKNFHRTAWVVPQNLANKG